jgi:hypothetical protein
VGRRTAELASPLVAEEEAAGWLYSVLRRQCFPATDPWDTPWAVERRALGGKISHLLGRASQEGASLPDAAAAVREFLLKRGHDDIVARADAFSKPVRPELLPWPPRRRA